MVNQFPETKTGISKPFRLYTWRGAPWLLQLAAGIMWIEGIILKWLGIFQILVFLFGVIPIIIGLLNIKNAGSVVRLQAKVLKSVFILQVLIASIFLVFWFTEWGLYGI